MMETARTLNYLPYREEIVFSFQVVIRCNGQQG